MRPIGSAQELERRRRRAIELLREGNSHAKVAEMVGSSTSSIDRWKKMAALGSEALNAKPHPGPTPFLDEAQERELEALLCQGAMQHGWANDLWTAQRVADVIATKFGRRFHPEHVRKILRERLDWSSQRPERRARERNEDEIARWKREEWPILKKR
jgi:transposase